MSHNMEIELKLQILNENMWETLPKSTWLKSLIAADSAKQETLEATYYDTPSRALWKNGYAFRIRHEGSSWVATLKGAGLSGGGLHQRREWNVPVLGPDINLEVFRQMDGAEKVLKILKDEALEPLLKTIFTRWSVLIHPQNSPGLLELVMDKGVINAADKNEDIYEVEIELKEGTAQDLLIFGAELSRRYPLFPEWKSKYYRGLRLAELPVAGKEKPAAKSPSTAATFLAEAIRKVLSAQTAYFAEQDTVEEIHDLRVALRKLRSRLSFAGPLYPAEEVQHWKHVLRSWNHRLAGIRELDVLLEEWEAAGEHLGRGSNSLLAVYLKAQRNRLADTLAKVMAGGKLTADLLAFWAWTADAETTGGREKAWQAYAGKRLEEWLKDVRQMAQELDHSDPMAIHRLRITGKKARYILEWHAQQDGQKDSKGLAVKLQQFQECLGDIHDADQGQKLLLKLKRGKQDLELVKEIALLMGWQARRGYDALQRFDTLNEEFYKAVKRWLKKRTEDE